MTSALLRRADGLSNYKGLLSERRNGAVLGSVPDQQDFRVECGPKQLAAV
jgi:hypothetical protein